MDADGRIDKVQFQREVGLSINAYREYTTSGVLKGLGAYFVYKNILEKEISQIQSNISKIGVFINRCVIARHKVPRIVSSLSTVLGVKISSTELLLLSNTIVSLDTLFTIKNSIVGALHSRDIELDYDKVVLLINSRISTPSGYGIRNVNVYNHSVDMLMKGLTVTDDIIELIPAGLTVDSVVPYRLLSDDILELENTDNTAFYKHQFTILNKYYKLMKVLIESVGVVHKSKYAKLGTTYRNIYKGEYNIIEYLNGDSSPDRILKLLRSKKALKILRTVIVGDISNTLPDGMRGRFRDANII